MNEEEYLIEEHPYFTYHYPSPSNPQDFSAPPVLNKLTTDPTSSSLYAAYEDGKVLRYDAKSSVLTNVFSIYDKTDIIDIEARGSTLLTCSHNEVTVFDIVKQKSLSLKVPAC
jgi:hypothetical protein